MVVFLNCASVYLNNSEANRITKPWIDEFYIRSQRNKVLQNTSQNDFFKGLNFVKKMEHEEERCREMTSGITGGLAKNLTSPASDCNSNNLTVLGENSLLCSSDSIQDCPDFLQDNSEYQWFLDYGYKDNNYSHHQSIFSLSRSQDLVYYEDMARNIDANLAEVDMDDFNREDIHSVLSTLPNIQAVEEREMFASVSGSMMVKFDLDSSISPHSSSQEENLNCTSICKSQLLFSPLHGSYLQNANLSIDSLDMSENDINLMVTCQANKNNYTIAFEGSTVMESEDSESQDIGNIEDSECEGNRIKKQIEPLKDSKEHFTPHTPSAMAHSDSVFTTWSKIKEDSSENLQLKRHPSGNNNNIDSTNCGIEINNSNTVKSMSMPNLCHQRQSGKKLNLSISVKDNRSENEQQCVKLYDIQNHSSSGSIEHSTSSASGKPHHNFSLVKLFIKQKSASQEGMSHYSNEQLLSNNCFKSDGCQNKVSELNNGQHLNKDSLKLFKTITDEKMKTLNADNCSLSSIKKDLFGKNEKVITDEITYLPISEQTPQILGKEKLCQKNDYNKSNQSTLGNHNSCSCSKENKYCSDESTQENGSNTESTENLICNCIKPNNLACKKSFAERSIQTSKYSESENFQKKQLKVPIYILYPNYSLPDLNFLKKKHYIQNIDFSKIFLRPQQFQPSDSSAGSPKINSKKSGKRPFSVNDIETLKKTGFKHVKDWESLTFLLPKEYKQLLQEIPEILAQLKDVKNTKEDLVPLFCLSPPPNRRVKRPISCEINFYNTNSRSSNFSSTATQPSSGYRGSSTMLNSNNSNSTNSPSGSSRRSGAYIQSKNYSVNNANEIPARPPLPRSILRNNSLDNQHYTCKTQKENANKRYSMIELCDKVSESGEKFTKKISPQYPNLKAFHSNVRKNEEEKQSVNNCGLNKSIKSNRQSVTHYDSFPEGKSNLENDMRRLEELLEISAVFGESIDSFTESDMLRLRSQVSKFLTMQKNLEKVSETLQTVNQATTNESNIDKYDETNLLGVKNLHTPHNTPEHKKQQKGTLEISNEDICNFVTRQSYDSSLFYEGNTTLEERDCRFKEDNSGNLGNLKKTVSFAENISFAVKEQESKLGFQSPLNSPSALSSNQKTYQASKKPVDLPICEESAETIPNSSTRNLQNSSSLLCKRDLVLDVRNAVDKILKHSSANQEDPASICLHHLCPSLYAVLIDGLKEEIDTPFGPIRNSVWGVIEASSQQGPMTQTLYELVQRLNRDDIFTEGLIKFNAFIFGLLNARALSGWLSYLRTRDNLLRKHYNSSGLLLMSNTAGAPVRVLVDQLISILETLSSLQFNLDLMYQTKLLHCSLQNLNSLLEEPVNKDFLTPTKQLMLLKLVQSIQNSISQNGEVKQGKRVAGCIEEKAVKPSGNFLEKGKSVRVRPSTNKSRPRSGYDILGAGEGTVDVAGAMKKRWSGVHLNSKLVEAFDKLGDDSESEYTDSLDNTRPKRQDRNSAKNASRKGSSINLATDSGKSEPDIYTKEQKKNILLNLNKKSCNRTDDIKTENEQKKLSDISQKQNGEFKFKRLQQKWEKLSGKSVSDSDSETTTPLGSPIKRETFEKQNCDTNITIPSPTTKTSKIPRLVTSPLTSGPAVKQTGNSKKLDSPTNGSHANIIQKPGKVYTVKTTAASNRLSKNSLKSEPTLASNLVKGHSTRPTSLPCRDFNTMPLKKNVAVSKRASSMSLNRKPAARKLQQVQRTVRTLTHRLPSDSGHLSFNEGEKLKVVLEVDKTWLLCCRGSQKGLVPKSAVISDGEDDKF